jgi:CDP-diacylglycerol---glycerol-3-phosphate 3-phosphatidyltransferase
VTAEGLAGHPAATRTSAVNLPNTLTLGRVLLVPVFATVLVTGGQSTGSRLLAVGLFVAACLTDVVDGWLARRWDQVTTFGVMVDPVADKALVGTALVTLSLLGELPWWATLVVLGREAGITGLRMLVLRHGLLPATRGGKLKCLTQNLVVVLYVLPLPLAAQGIRAPVLLLAVASTVLTGVDYLARAVRLRRGSPTAS